MAGPDRRSSPDLKNSHPRDIIQDLLDNGRVFSFFQAVRLLRQHIKSAPATESEAVGDLVRMRPRLSLAFPSADIDRIEQLEVQGRSGYRITANFLGLYGTASPLPTFYTEDLLSEASQDEAVSRDFIDILNQRLYALLFQGWLKYRLFFQIAEEKNGAHLERLFCLLGLGSEGLHRRPEQSGHDMGLLRYIGLFTQFPRSAAGLRTLLSDALRGVPLQIVPCVSRKTRIPEFQRLRVGSTGSRLGLDAYLGEEIEDRMGKFRIRIGPLNQAGFLDFVPDRAGYATLTGLTELYMTEPLAYEVELVLAARQARTVCLGDPVRAVLGVTTWVFSKAHLGEVRTRFSVRRR